MAGSNRLINVGGGMVKITRERELPLPKNRGGIETPISAIWHVVGKPSDLALLQIYAQKLGISIHWEPSFKDQGSTDVVRGKKAIRESE